MWLLLPLAAGCGADAGGNVAGSAGGSATDASRKGELLVSAAANLAPVLQELTPLFEEQAGARVELNLGSTGQLAQQIEAGAPVDVFLAASAEDTDRLSTKRVIPDTREVFARGRLVIWTRPDGPDLKKLGDLTQPEVARIAIANPEHAPYGRAAREALQDAGLWEDLQPKLVMGENVQQAFQFAQSGNADAALVALSLAVPSNGRHELVPEEMHQPLEQALVVIAGSRNEELARRFAEFMLGDQARVALERYGYQLP